MDHAVVILAGQQHDLQLRADLPQIAHLRRGEAARTWSHRRNRIASRRDGRAPLRAMGGGCPHWRRTRALSCARNERAPTHNRLRNRLVQRVGERQIRHAGHGYARHARSRPFVRARPGARARCRCGSGAVDGCAALATLSIQLARPPHKSGDREDSSGAGQQQTDLRSARPAADRALTRARDWWHAAAGPPPVQRRAAGPSPVQRRTGDAEALLALGHGKQLPRRGGRRGSARALRLARRPRRDGAGDVLEGARGSSREACPSLRAHTGCGAR